MICTTATTIHDSLSTLNSQFLSWLAGFWEGEGCLSIANETSRHPRVCLGIAQSKDRGKKILEEIQKVFNTGHVHANYPKTGKYQSVNPVWSWQVACVRDVIFIADLLLPYMHFRGSEVKDKLERIKAIDYGRSTNPWAIHEIEYLRKYHGKKTNAQIGKHLDREAHSVVEKAHSLGITKTQHFWTPSDLKFLLDNFGKISANDIGAKLGRSYSNVHQKIIHLRKEGKVGKVANIDKINWSVNAKKRIKGA